MRPIKFRGWDKEKKQWTSPCSGSQGNVSLMIFDTPGIEVTQFTGLLDRHGKEIYEGDIIKEWFLEKPLEWSTWKVTFENSCFGYSPCKPDIHHLDDRCFKPFYQEGELRNLNNFEVIGNIYEHGEKGG